MSVVVTYNDQIKTVETLPNNTGSASAANRVVTHDQYDEAVTLNSGTTPPVTQIAAFLLTLSGGTVNIDLTALVGTNGATLDGTGLKIQIIRIKNLGANPMVIKSGASNGHTGVIGATTGETIPVGGHMKKFTGDQGDDIDATHKILTVTGTGSQTAEVTIVLG